MVCWIPPNAAATTINAQCPSQYRSWIEVDDNVLQSSVLTVTVPAEEITPERTQDIQTVFYALMLVFATLWGIKKLLRLFTGDPER
jgi:hypothetical protein